MYVFGGTLNRTQPIETKGDFGSSDTVDCVDWQEYEGLTNKIHELQMREQQLNEVLFDYQQAAPATAADADDSLLMMSDTSGLYSASMSPGADIPHTSALHDEDSASSSKTPMRGTVRAYLPKKMTTVVSPFIYSTICLSLSKRQVCFMKKSVHNFLKCPSEW